MVCCALFVISCAVRVACRLLFAGSRFCRLLFVVCGLLCGVCGFVFAMVVCCRTLFVVACCLLLALNCELLVD